MLQLERELESELVGLESSRDPDREIKMQSLKTTLNWSDKQTKIANTWAPDGANQDADKHF